MANGERKRIDQVEEGDYVLATDPETGETGAREVIATLPHTDQLLTLRLSSGDVITTEDHKYWNATDRAWQESQHLDPGDRLLTPCAPANDRAGCDRRAGRGGSGTTRPLLLAHDGQWKTGFWDLGSRVFLGQAADLNITTVMTNVDAAYVGRLKAAQP